MASDGSAQPHRAAGSEAPVTGSCPTPTPPDSTHHQQRVIGAAPKTPPPASTSTIDATQNSICTVIAATQDSDSVTTQGSDSNKSGGGSDAAVFASVDEMREHEWDCVKISHRSGNSRVYTYMHEVKLDMSKVEKYPNILEESEALKMVMKGEHWLCTICKRQKKPLQDCLRKMKFGFTTNGNTHLNSDSHKKIIAEIEGEKVAKEKKAGRKRYQDEKEVDSFFSPQQRKKARKMAPSQHYIDECHKLQFRFINNGNHPDSVCEDPNFRNLLGYCVENAKYLKGGSIFMGRRKFVTIQCASFDEFTCKVSALLDGARNWYLKNTGSYQPFVNVASDVWDGRRKQINGLTIFFMDPESLVLYRIPVALTPPLGKSAIKLCETCMLGLDRVGVRFTDLHRSINDNCAPAVKAGRLLIAGESETMSRRSDEVDDGECHMHLSSLSLGLSLSLVERRVNKKVVNYWAPFQDLYKKTKAGAKYIFDKKNKRFPSYKESLDKINKSAIAVSLPGGTRVGGAMLLIQDLLRSVSALRYYASVCEPFEKLSLARFEWRQLAQFEAVMRKALLLCFDAQGERPEIAAEVALTLAELKSEYKYGDVYDVVDVDSGAWEATTQFKDLPRVMMTTNPKKAREENKRIMTDDSIELVGRVVSSFDEYFGEVSDDRLLAMIVNPHLATNGFKDLSELEGDKGDELFERAKKLLKKHMERLAKPAEPESPSLAVESSEDTDASGSVGLNPKEKLKRARLARKKKEESTSSLTTTTCIESAIESYLNMTFDPMSELKAQYKRTGKSSDGIDWERVKEFDTLYISSLFDSIEWWKEIGRNNHPQVYPVFPAIIALPASNDFQERIFSACTWFDDPLRQRLKDKRFEMAVILAVNKTLLSSDVPSEEKAKEIVANVLAKFERSDDLFDASLDMGIDLEAKDFIMETDDDENSSASMSSFQ